MSKIAQNLDLIWQKINQSAKNSGRKTEDINLIAVSKNFDSSAIKQAIACGCKVFGENKVQETKEKWPKIKEEFGDITLHLIGHLQSNKAKEAVALFDVIQTLDSDKLAKALEKEMIRQNKFPQVFVQINIGQEQQKYGLDPKEATEFINKINSNYKFKISGVMGIAPLEKDASLYFALLKKIANENNLQNISMGMSEDFETAIALGSNFIRIGTAIFGDRS
jgi:hypothetical protein